MNSLIWPEFFYSRASNSKWKVRCDRNWNSSEILWLSWLPASLKKIQSKVNTLSSGQHFLHFMSMGKNFHCSRASNSKVNSPMARNQTCPRFYGCPRYLQVWWRSDQKWSCYPPDNIFPIISLWELSVAWKPVLNQSEQKPPQWCYI